MRVGKSPFQFGKSGPKPRRMEATIKTKKIQPEDLDLFAPEMRPRLQNTVILSAIFVPKEHRGQGIGSRALQKFVDELDASGTACVLDTFAFDVFPDGSETLEKANERLERWYRRFGFESDDHSFLMIRFPRRTDEANQAR